MVRCICRVRDDDKVSAHTLCAMLGVQEVTAALHTRRLRWFGHAARSSSCINSITSMTIPSARRGGRPKKTLSECVKADMKMCSLGSIDPLKERRGDWMLDTLASCCLPKYWGVKFPNKLLTLMSQIFLRDAVNYKSTTQIRKNFYSPCITFYSQMQAGEWNFTPLQYLGHPRQ